ncbi:MAG: DUF4124 domain-containing protein [Gammaproteobacteria bacterium]
MSIQSQIPKIVSTLLMTVFFCTPVAAKETQVTRWVDQNGVTHYGSYPPLGVEAAVLKTTHGAGDDSKSQPSKVESHNESDPPTLDERVQSLLAQREQQCKQEKERLATLKTPNALIAMKLDDGTTKDLTPEEIASDIDSTEKFIERACKGMN